MLQVLRYRLGQSILYTHEMSARKALFDNVQFQFLADGNTWTAGTYDFSTLSATSAYQMRLKFILESKLRMAERSYKWTQQWSTFAAPVPNFPNDALIMVTPNIMYDLWATDDGTFMEDLRQLQDYRVINGGAARYHGCLLYTSPSPRDRTRSRMPSSA